MFQVLITDSAGMPKDWVSYEDAVCYYAKHKVLWEVGATIKTFYGGYNTQGEQSSIDISSIIGVSGPLFGDKFLNRINNMVTVREILYARDRNVCAYCGDEFGDRELTIDHVIPRAQGGRHIWTNTVSACKPCNSVKGCKTPEQAHMPLLYVPYAPSVFEKMILRNRRILADQMEFLLARVPKNSRLHQAA